MMETCILCGESIHRSAVDKIRDLGVVDFKLLKEMGFEYE